MKTFKEFINEDGVGAGGMGTAPANNVGSGNIAGTGGKAGEPGVSRKRKSPVIMSFKRNPPKM
jgi:hypothetical protein